MWVNRAESETIAAVECAKAELRPVFEVKAVR